MCDSYAGLDVSCPVPFTTLKRNGVNREIFVHPNDLHIKTFFEELMEGLNPEVEEEESESEDELPLRAAVANKKQTKALPAGAASGAVEVADPAAEEKKLAVKHGEECDDSECEGCEEFTEPEGSFFEVLAVSGAFLYREPELDEQLKIGSVPAGTVVRCYESSDSVAGWAELAGASAWLHVDDPENVKPLASFLELPLRTVVQTRLPLILLKRWVQKSKGEITAEDITQISEIDETRIRMTIEELVRGRIGDKRFETLLDETEVVASKSQERILKARGFFASQNGILWHVNPQGAVRGMHPDGSKIRDRVVVSKENEIRIGPFALDETRNCSCIHWHRKDDPERAWVWSRDDSVNTRLRMGFW